MSIRFYCGVASCSWNGYCPQPGAYTCVSPITGKQMNSVRLPRQTAVLLDSGAFSDEWAKRLPFSAALDRQLSHAERYGYAEQVEAVASYDLLIDEMWVEGRRIKQRWGEAEAWAAVRETVSAARWLAENYSGRRVLSAQGVSPAQYEACTLQVLEWLGEGDIFGLGGWCIGGKMPKQMLPPFGQTLTRIMPHLAEAKVARVHIWGVTAPEFLGRLLWACDQHGIEVSTDGCGPQLAPTRGDWGFSGWPNRVNRGLPKLVGKQSAVARAVHVCQTRHYFDQLRESQHYLPPLTPRFVQREQLGLI